jgi:hypothetical protein
MHTMADLLAQTRLGLHVTREELNIWRQRALSGPYKSRSDVSANSPDDWTRIVNNASAFKANPASFRWNGPQLFEASGAVQKGTGDDVRLQNEPNGNALAHHIRDAAFLLLVDEKRSDRAALKQAVKAELLHATSIGSLNFNNRTFWPSTYYRDINPLFQTMNWFNNYLYAYDYLDIADGLSGETTFSQEERNRINSWLLAAAEFAQQEQDWDVNRLFTNRSSSSADAPYTPLNKQSPAQRNGADLLTHYTASGPGHTIYGLMQTFNNRRMACHRYAALVGIKVGRQTMVESAKRYVKDWIKYSVFTDGTMGEMERWNSTIPDLGWAYCTDVVASAVTIADALARRGDHSLYDYNTSIGLYGTEGSGGQSKNLHKTLKMMYNIAAKRVQWYGTNDKQNCHSSYLIDGETASWKALHDVWLTMANLKYKDHEIKAMYMRQGAGMTPYWSNPTSQGKHLVWTGDWGIFPGLLFMFGQMEDKVNPYPGSAAPIAVAPEPVSVNPAPAASGQGSIVIEYWHNIGSYDISSIPVRTTPNKTVVLNSFEGAADVADNYGSRIRGYVHPPTNGNYMLWVAGDNTCELWLSTDENPANKRLIATVNGWTRSNEWSKYPSQKSSSIYLEGGKKYYIEVLQKEVSGGDNIAVGWQLPNGTLERPIPGMRLSPFTSNYNSVAKVDAEERVDYAEITLQAYPNPFTDLVHIDLGYKAEETLITVSDITGKTVYQENVRLSGEGSTLTLDLSAKGLMPGMYILRIDSGKGNRKTIKLIKS